MTFTEAVALIKYAKSAQDIFGKDSPSLRYLFNGTSFEPAGRYKMLIRLCHPDRFTDPKKKAIAEEATTRLNELYGQLTTPEVVPSISVDEWVVQSPLCKGDICDLHNVANPTIQGVLKVARSADDNELLDREKNSLQHLKTMHGEGHSYIRYLPNLLDNLIVGDCRANVLSVADECYTLKQLKEVLGPIEPRHLIWMMNRLLSILGYAHRCGVVHGQITPDHLMYRPKDHGLVLVGWCSSIRAAKKESDRLTIPYLSKEWSGLYPSEVTKKHAAYPQTDIDMAMRSIGWAGYSEEYGVLLPKRFKPLMEYCTADVSPASRPVDAWEVQTRWRELAREEYGAPSFVPLHVPVS